MAFRQELKKSIRYAKILYVDKGLIVINKPSGLVCQGGRQQGNSAYDFDKFIDEVGRRLKVFEAPVQVHRLDKLTTGTYLLARNTRFAKELANQFQARTIKKTYLALVRGGEKSFPGTKGTINAGISISEDGVRIDRDRGQVALTDWELLGSSDVAPLSLLRLSLFSGLKHQLRIHLAQVLQCPVLGDSKYSSKPPASTIMSLLPPNIYVGPSYEPPSKEIYNERLFLHASHISVFRYRNVGNQKRFRLGVSAPLPQDFVSICDAAGLKQYLTPENITGGVDVDDVPWLIDEEVQGVEGRWLNKGHPS